MYVKKGKGQRKQKEHCLNRSVDEILKLKQEGNGYMSRLR